jgi:solute carrier family 25 oxoglutarate transporter 11
MQNQKPGPDGKLPYTGTFQTMTNIIRNEGAASMWKGFMPYFGRCGGHTVMMFIFVEQYKKLAQYMYQK